MTYRRPRQVPDDDVTAGPDAEGTAVTRSPFSWQCSNCAATYPVETVRYACPCDPLARLDFRLPVPALPGQPAAGIDQIDRTLWRYAQLLPLKTCARGPRLVRERFPSGCTPLVRADRLGAQVGLNDLWIKDESANPTGSLKDRASSLVAAAALEQEHAVVATASSGNAAVSMAVVARAVGLACVVFVPASIAAEQVARLTRLGASVLVVDGDYDDSVRLSLRACDAFGWLCRTAAVNPFTTQGNKTAALEVAEQLGWRAPDVVVAPVGDGNVLVGLHHGFRDAARLGWIDRIPRLIAVQAEGAPAVFRAWWSERVDVPVAPAHTIAGGIAVGAPMDGRRAIAALASTGGAAVVVSDEQMTAAVAQASLLEGLDTEPAAAAAIAALAELVQSGLVRATERVVVVNTGAGLRRAASGEPAPAVVVTPDSLEGVRAALASAGNIPTDRTGAWSGLLPVSGDSGA